MFDSVAFPKKSAFAQALLISPFANHFLGFGEEENRKRNCKLYMLNYHYLTDYVQKRGSFPPAPPKPKR
jgi:hypothetical protein